MLQKSPLRRSESWPHMYELSPGWHYMRSPLTVTLPLSIYIVISVDAITIVESNGEGHYLAHSKMFQQPPAPKCSP